MYCPVRVDVCLHMQLKHGALDVYTYVKIVSILPTSHSARRMDNIFGECEVQLPVMVM